MSDETISGMTAASALTGAELVPLVQGGANVQASLSAIMAAFFSGFSGGNIAMTGGNVTILPTGLLTINPTGNLTLTGGNASMNSGGAINVNPTGALTMHGSSVAIAPTTATGNTTGGAVTITGGAGAGSGGDGNVTISAGAHGNTTGQVILKSLPTKDPSSTGAVYVGNATGNHTLLSS